MFEAISDSRIFGIEYDPRMVKIVAAGNYGEAYTGAQDLDSALVARFATFYKPTYDEKDVWSFLRYLKRTNDPNENHNELFTDFLENKIKDEGVGAVVSILKQTETQSIERGVPSTRAFEQASHDFHSMSFSLMYCGSSLFNTVEKENILAELADRRARGESYDSLYTFLKDNVPKILSGVDSWAAKKKGENIITPAGTFSADQLVNMLKTVNREILQNQTSFSTATDEEKKDAIDGVQFILTNMNVLDLKIKKNRLDTFHTYFGTDFSQEFTPYFNARFGTAISRITVPMLDDINNIDPFIVQTFGTFAGTAEEWLDKVRGIVNEFMDCHGENLNTENYYKLLLGMINNSYSVETSQRLFITLSDPRFDAFVAKAEGVGDHAIKEIVRVASGLTITDDAIEGIRKSISQGTKRTTGKARFL